MTYRDKTEIGQAASLRDITEIRSTDLHTLNPSKELRVCRGTSRIVQTEIKPKIDQTTSHRVETENKYLPTNTIPNLRIKI